MERILELTTFIIRVTMEVVGSSETSVTTYHCTEYNIPEYTQT